MSGITGSVLRDRAAVLECRETEKNVFRWEEAGRIWAGAEPDDRRNLFSSVGIGARGVTFTIRVRPGLTLHQAFCWKGRHCFLTSILPHPEHRGYQTVKAALVTPVDCQTDLDQTVPGVRFPGVVTEKYAGHEQLDPMAVVTRDLVLITPKAVRLDPGAWVRAGEEIFQVRVPHELDAWKNEYEIRRRRDC